MTAPSPNNQVGAESEYGPAALEYRATSSRLLIVLEQDTFVTGSGFVRDTLALAKLRIEYRPSDMLLEWGSLRRFLEGFATKALSLEDTAAEIYAHIATLVSPSELRVVLERIDGPGDLSYRVIAGR